MSGAGTEGDRERRVEAKYEKLKKEAAAGGYFLNPDEPFAKDLAESLLVNEERYGYAACPCRLSGGRRELDLDIICPCDYRDADVEEHGACYCALYVSGEVARGQRDVEPVPERRPDALIEAAAKGELPVAASQPTERAPSQGAAFGGSSAIPVWRCKVCGYLCARDNPPGVCPICKVTKDRFERFY